MTAIVRALGIGLAAVAAHLLMSLGDDPEGGANIGAGLAVFAVLTVGGFTWALLDGLGVRGDHRAHAHPGVGALVGRWVGASAGTVAVVALAMSLRQGGGYLADVGASSVLFLLGLVLVPALVGIALGRVARSPRTVEAGRPRAS